MSIFGDILDKYRRSRMNPYQLADSYRPLLHHLGTEPYLISTGNDVVAGIPAKKVAERPLSLMYEKYPYLKMRIVGDGSALPELKQYVKDNNIEDITFTGGLSGQTVIEEYKNADFFFTSHGEGMPTVVLEAMAFGLHFYAKEHFLASKVAKQIEDILV